MLYISLLLNALLLIILYRSLVTIKRLRWVVDMQKTAMQSLKSSKD